MLLVLLCCAAPVIASYFTYYVVRPEGRTRLRRADRSAAPAAATRRRRAWTASRCACRSLKGQWLLVSVAGGACDALCEQQLYLQRQLRESLGKEKDRLDRVWLVDDDAPVPRGSQPALRGATVLRVPAAAARALAGASRRPCAGGAPLSWSTRWATG